MKTMIREMRSRPHRVVHNVSSSSLPPWQPLSDEPSSMKLSSWANMPEELLREVLIKIESSDTTWPNRKNLVACAGVCRSWRRITKEIVPCLEACGVVTFPISIKQPGPRESLVQCFIKRNRTAQTYQLYLNVTNSLVEDGKFLLSARRYRRTTCTDYIISLKPDDMSSGGNTYVGKLRSNFLGTKFTVFDGLPPHAGTKLTNMPSTTQMDLGQVSSRVPVGKYPVAHISYELDVMGSRGPRKMYCIMDAISNSAIKPGGVAPTQTDFPLSSVDAPPSIPFFRSRSCHTENFHSGDPIRKDGVLVLRNKSPRWHEQLQCWCLNFHGRVTVASVKNFQLVASPESGQAGQEHGKIILQFGKVGKDLFTMDYRYPISAFQAFALCLSSFDTKIACE